MTVTVGPKLGKMINANVNDDYVDAFRPLLRAIDQLTFNSVFSNSLSNPPVNPNNGDAYIVGLNPSGSWVGQTGNLAVWSTEITVIQSNTKVPNWEFYVPQEGWHVWVASIAQQLRFTNGAWTSLQAGFADGVLASTGLQDGTNTSFTLPHTPNPPDGHKVYVNGLRLTQGADSDYTLVNNSVTFTVAPAPTDSVVHDYRY